MCLCMCMCTCAFVRACVRACVCVCVCVCEREQFQITYGSFGSKVHRCHMYDPQTIHWTYRTECLPQYHYSVEY